MDSKIDSLLGVALIKDCYPHYHEDNIPFGEAALIVVDPDQNSLFENIENMKCCFLKAALISVNMGFEEWLESGMPELNGFYVETN